MNPISTNTLCMVAETVEGLPRTHGWEGIRGSDVAWYGITVNRCDVLHGASVCSKDYEVEQLLADTGGSGPRGREPWEVFMLEGKVIVTLLNAEKVRPTLQHEQQPRDRGYRGMTWRGYRDSGDAWLRSRHSVTWQEGRDSGGREDTRES